MGTDNQVNKTVETSLDEPVVETLPENSMSKKQIKNLFEEHTLYDISNYSYKKGGFVFKRSYFYGMMKDPKKFGQSIEEEAKIIGLTPIIVDTTNNWNRWPKDSWFEAVVKFKQLKEK